MGTMKSKTAAKAEGATSATVKGKGETVKGADGAPLVELGPIETVKLADVKAGVNVCRPDGHTAAHLAALTLAMPTPSHQRDPVWIGADGTLVAGFGRFAVATANKWPTIAARRIVNDSPAVRVLANLCENERSDERIGVMGRAAAYASLQRDGMSVRAIAAATGNAKSTDVVVDVCRIGDPAKTHPLTRAALDAHSKGLDGIVKVKWTEAGEKGEKAREGETMPRPFGVVRHVSKAEWTDQPAILRATGTMSSDEARVYVSAYRDARKAGKDADAARKDAAAAARPGKGKGEGEGEGEGTGKGDGGNAATSEADAFRQSAAAILAPALEAIRAAIAAFDAAAKRDDVIEQGMDADESAKHAAKLATAYVAAAKAMVKVCGESAAADAAAKAGQATAAKAATKARR